MSELVVLLDEDGRAVGTADKAGVHHAATPLHLAFSVYLFDADGRVLVTRRALTKRTFAGVWTNSCCGHPAPGEDLTDAVRRRVRQELRAEVSDLRLLLPAFRYRAEQDGVVENEMCPVFVGIVRVLGDPDPTEVDATSWETWADFRAGVLDGTRPVSVWCREQVAALPEDPLGAPEGRVEDLPAAVQPQG
ncbi:MAG: isopentenyl-diphosphate Delta-isomerase [Nocardioides sp.]